MTDSRTDRGGFLRRSGATVATLGLAGALPETAAAAPGEVDILLVHGAFFDGSSWRRVISLLQRAGYFVTAVQLDLRSLADDAARVRRAIDASTRPLVVAGHSFGGLVVSAATPGAANVKALVFIAALAPERGESAGALLARVPPAPIVEHFVVDSQGDITVDRDGFVDVLMPDVARRAARVFAAAQRPLNAAAVGEPARGAGWRTIPSYYQVSTRDRVIAPSLQRFLARRMHAVDTLSLHSSHASLVSHPAAIARLIARAAGA